LQNILSFLSLHKTVPSSREHDTHKLQKENIYTYNNIRKCPA